MFCLFQLFHTCKNYKTGKQEFKKINFGKQEFKKKLHSGKQEVIKKFIDGPFNTVFFFLFFFSSSCKGVPNESRSKKK